MPLVISALRESRRRAALAFGLLLLALAAAWWPAKALETVDFVTESFIDVAPMIGVGLVLTAWLGASGAASMVAKLFHGRPTTMIVLASAIGAVTPVCGVTALPLMVGFLASGVPLAPIMAFWLSSPVTDPGLFAATWAVLGPAFGIGKTVAAFALGIFAGTATSMLSATEMVRRPLRSARHSVNGSCSAASDAKFTVRIWRENGRLRAFGDELVWMTKLVVACLVVAFAAEHLLRDLLPPDVLATYVGSQSPYAIPLAATVGAPLYLDGYAALPLIRGLLDLGMSPGAALAFLVAGSAVSIWGVLAVVPVLRASTTALFVLLAFAGSLAVGYAFEAIWGLLP